MSIKALLVRTGRKSKPPPSPRLRRTSAAHMREEGGFPSYRIFPSRRSFAKADERAAYPALCVGLRDNPASPGLAKPNKYRGPARRPLRNCPRCSQRCSARSWKRPTRCRNRSSKASRKTGNSDMLPVPFGHLTILGI